MIRGVKSFTLIIVFWIDQIIDAFLLRRCQIRSSAHSNNRPSRLGCAREQAVLGKEFDHEAIEEPGLFYLAGVAGSGQSFQFAIRDERLEREGALMAIVLAAGQDYCRTGDALVMALRIGLRERFELVDDRLHVGVFVALGEKVGEEMCHRCRAK